MLSTLNLDQFRLDLDAKVTALSSRLTPRETQVAQGILDGLTSKEIAAQFGTSPRTIEVHRGRVFSKLGIKGATNLARLVVASGTPESGPPLQRDELTKVARALAAPLRLRRSSGSKRFYDIISEALYFPRPSEDAINVFMMWNEEGHAAGYLLVPEPIQIWIANGGMPDVQLARPLAAAISYGFFLALHFGVALRLTGDRRVWSPELGHLPTGPLSLAARRKLEVLS